MKKKSTGPALAAYTDKKWQAEDDLRICQQYEQIKRDPARMKAVRALAKERLTDLEKLVQ